MVKNKESWECLCSCALNTLPKRPALFLSRPFLCVVPSAPHVAAQIEKAAETSCFGVESRLREAYNECTTFRQSKAFRTEIYVMIILTQPISKGELSELAKTYFGDMVKGVADVDKGLVSLDAELHSDLEAMLLDQGSEQNSLWGFNLYPELEDEDFLEFDSLINIRPAQGNRSRGVEDELIQQKLKDLMAKWIRE